VDTSSEKLILCKHCGKEIPDSFTHRETCPKQAPVNGILLSHGLEVEDYIRLQMKERRQAKP